MLVHLRDDPVREVDRIHHLGLRFHVPLVHEHQDLVLKQDDLDLLNELRLVIQIALPLLQLEQLGERLAVLGAAPLPAALLVLPVGRDALVGDVVHLLGADLDLYPLRARPDHRRVQRLIQVRLGQRDELLEAPRHRRPVRVHDAQLRRKQSRTDSMITRKAMTS